MGVKPVSTLCLVDPSRLEAWDGILSHTRAMLEAGRAGDWDRVVALEAIRRDEIARFFAGGIADYEVVHVRQGIQEILESDRKLLDISQREKTQCSAQIVQLRRRAAVQRTYGAAAG
jgi:hypothetical protein